ncbi:MAG: HD domain-containing protein [Candidatus Aenigmatarchaeota archaeon]
MDINLDDLLKLADRIEDKKIREKTKDFLKNPKLTNVKLDYEVANLEKIPSWIGAHHSYEGGLIEHIYSVVKLTIKMSEILEEVYDRKIDKDYLISGALLHDISKVFILKEESKGYSINDHLLDHSLWCACELYSRGFPEEVIEIVSGHGGEFLEPAPITIESTILQLADDLDATSESMDGKDLFYVLEDELK